MNWPTTQTQNQGLIVNAPQHPSPLRPAGRGGGLVDPGLQDLHSTGQQSDVQEESLWGSSVSSVAETRGLWPMILCNECLHAKMYGKGVYCVTHRVTLQFPWQEFLFPLSSFAFSFLFFNLKFWFVFLGGCVTRAEGGGKGTEDAWDWHTWCERHREQIKKKGKRYSLRMKVKWLSSLWEELFWMTYKCPDL